MYSVTSVRERQRESGRDRESLAETQRVWLEVRDSLAETETQSLVEAERVSQRKSLMASKYSHKMFL